jgi:hypothetical protein
MLTNTMTDSDICVAAFPAHIHILPSMNLLLLCLAAEAADRNDHVAAILRDDVIAYIKSALTSDKDNLRSKLTFPACDRKCGCQRLRRWAWKYCFNICRPPEQLQCVIKPTSLAPQHQLGVNSRTCTAAEFIIHVDSFYVGEDIPLVLLRCVEGMQRIT